MNRRRDCNRGPSKETRKPIVCRKTGSTVLGPAARPRKCRSRPRTVGAIGRLPPPRRRPTGFPVGRLYIGGATAHTAVGTAAIKVGVARTGTRGPWLLQRAPRAAEAAAPMGDSVRTEERALLAGPDSEIEAGVAGYDGLRGADVDGVLRSLGEQADGSRRGALRRCRARGSEEVGRGRLHRQGGRRRAEQRDSQKSQN